MITSQQYDEWIKDWQLARNNGSDCEMCEYDGQEGDNCGWHEDTGDCYSKYLSLPEYLAKKANELNNQQICETCEFKPICSQYMFFEKQSGSYDKQVATSSEIISQKLDYCSLYKQKEQS